MPVSPKRQRELRARRRDQKEFPTKRCLNCSHFYKQRVPNKKFCSVECKNEFGRFGAAYGPLKDKLEKLIDKTVRERVAEMEARLEARTR